MILDRAMLVSAIALKFGDVATTWPVIHGRIPGLHEANPRVASLAETYGPTVTMIYVLVASVAIIIGYWLVTAMLVEYSKKHSKPQWQKYTATIRTCGLATFVVIGLVVVVNNMIQLMSVIIKW